MLTETARVVAVAPRSVWVETVRQSVCARCAARSGCGHGLLNRWGRGANGTGGNPDAAHSGAHTTTRNNPTNDPTANNAPDSAFDASTNTATHDTTSNSLPPNCLELSCEQFPADSFRVDDQVVIGVPEGFLLSGTFVLYGLPLLLALLGAALGSLWSTLDAVAVGGAAGGFALGLALVRLHAARHRHGLVPRLLGHAPNASRDSNPHTEATASDEAGMQGR